jgi:hypothetical protein
MLITGLIAALIILSLFLATITQAPPAFSDEIEEPIPVKVRK